MLGASADERLLALAASCDRGSRLYVASGMHDRMRVVDAARRKVLADLDAARPSPTGKGPTR